VNKIAYVYVFDTIADWEFGYIIAELNSGRYFKHGTTKCIVKTMSLTKDSITTTGGIRITPDITIDECTKDDASVLILPGGDTWLEAIHMPIVEKAKEFLNENILVAAICGATLAFGQAGLLDHCNHTSNDLDYMKSVAPNYKGEKFYRQKPAITDGKLITASGVAPLEFAYEILKKMDVFYSETLEAWYQLYVTHEPRYFYNLMNSLGNKA
jgi:putative intracellular protease/amidase